MSRYKKLTNNIIDQRLVGKNIKRIDNFINSSIAINFQCLVCFHIWKARPKHFFGGGGCPKCYGNIKLTNEIIDKRLSLKLIKRLDNFINLRTKINFQCLICNSIIFARADKVFCANCVKNNRIISNNSSVDNQLLNRNIKRLDNIENMNDTRYWQCLIRNCQYVWKTKPSHIIYDQSGCPRCAGQAEYTNGNIDFRLIGRNIHRIDDVMDGIHGQTKINFQCLLCNNIWKATISKVIHDKSGCPFCIHKNELLIFSILKSKNIPFEYRFPIKNIDSNLPYYVLDFYLPQHNTIIEYNGRQHYEPVCFGNITMERAIQKLNKQITRDKQLDIICKNKNIKLI